MKKTLIASIFYLLLLIPLCLNAGLQILSDFETKNNNSWEQKFQDGIAILTNSVISYDKFQGNACIKFKADNINDWSAGQGAWKWFPASVSSWSNYGKFVFAIRVINIYTNTQGKPDWQWRNENLNFGFTIKEAYGRSDWKGEVWNYYITNLSFITDYWYIFETDITKSNANNWNSRLNKWQDDETVLGKTNDYDLNNNLFPPRGVNGIEYFYKTGNTNLLNNQVTCLDFMAIMSTPCSAALFQTNYFPMNLNWNDAAGNHPVYQIQIMTNSTNSRPVVNAVLGGADSLSSCQADALTYDLKPYHKYFWKLRSGYVLNSGTGFYSGAYKKYNLDRSMSSIPSSTSVTLWSYYSGRSFFSNNGIRPFNPASFSPVNNSSNFGVSNMNFTWEDLRPEGADAYIFALSSNRAMTRTVTVRTLSSTNYLLSGVTSYFSLGSNYYYSVRSGYTNYHASSVTWDRSSTNRFVFDFVAARLTDPPDLYTIYSNDYTFRWTGVFDGVTYELQISPDISFTTVATSVSGPEISSASVHFSTNRFSNNQYYYWRVKSLCGLGTKYSSSSR
ncbi:MAG: hypothetical protein PHF84_05250, partial [bacterium]|nr:hypothetical protein [bacterium]